MFAQDCLEVFVSFASHDDRYLNYIFGPSSAPVVAPESEVAGFLKIQEFGLFDINNKV